MSAPITSPSAVSSSRSRRAAITIGIFLLALFVRLLYLYDSSDNPTFDQPIVDAGAYDELARSVAEGAPIGERFFWQAFFYPAFLSLLHVISGASVTFARVVQVVLGSLTCVLTYRLGEQAFDRRVGVLAAIITALYGPLIFFEAELLATGWAAFWSVALVLLFMRARATRGPAACLALGICAALGVLTRPTFLPFILVAVLWLGIVLRRACAGWRPALFRLLIIVAGFALVALPVAIQKYRVTGRFGILPESGAINFYIGNNPDPCETLTIRPGSEWLRFRRQPAQSGVVEPGDSEQFFRDKTLEYVRSQPLGFIAGLGRKTLQFIGSRELPRNVDVYMFTQWSGLLRMLTWKLGPFGFPFGVLLPLTVLGLVFRWRQTPAPTLLLLVLYPLSVILVFVAARYRLPVIPAMATLAAAGAVAAIEIIRSRNWRRLAIAAGCCVAALLLCTLPGPFCEEKLDLEAEMYRGLGWNHYRAGRLDEAIAHTSHALALDPESATAHNNLGMFLRQKENLDQAAACFLNALRIEPDHANAHVNLGGVWMMQGKLGSAATHFSEGLRYEPDNPNTHVLLASVLSRQGRHDEAPLHYEEALRLAPDLAPARKGLAATRARLAKLDLAIGEYRQALRLDPQRANVRLQLAVALEQKGEIEAAVGELRVILRDDPQQPQALRQLEAATTRLAVRQQAQAIVESLAQQLNDARLVARRLREDELLSVPVRQAALDLLLRRTAHIPTEQP